MSHVKRKPYSFKDWMKENFERHELRDMLRHGVQGGFHGLIYYSETSELYDQYHKDIWCMINEDADSMDLSSIAFIASFTKSGDIWDDKTFKNLLVWYAAERVAYELTEI